MLNINR